MQTRHIFMILLAFNFTILILIPDTRRAIANTPIHSFLSIPLPVYGLALLSLLYVIRNTAYYIYLLSAAVLISIYLIYAQVVIYQSICFFCITANLLFAGLWLIEITLKNTIKRDTY